MVNETNIYKWPSEKSGFVAAVDDSDSLPHSTPPVDSNPSLPHHESMSSVTREEFDAKLETIEVKMDARVASIESKIDTFLKIADDRSLRLEKSFDEVKQTSSNLKFWLVGTALATVLGLYAANISMVQTMLASFESGKSLSATQVEFKRQADETALVLEKIQKQIPKSQPPR